MDIDPDGGFGPAPSRTLTSVNAPTHTHTLTNQPLVDLLHQTLRVNPCTSAEPDSCIDTAAIAVTGNLAASIERVSGLGVARWKAVESIVYAQPSSTREILALGIPEANGFAGMVRVFMREGGAWVALPSLSKATGMLDDRFGHSLAISRDGRWLAVGVPGDSTVPEVPPVDAHGSGAVHVYEWQGNAFSLRSVIHSPNPGGADAFGSALAMDATGDVIAVGAPFDDSPAEGSFDAAAAVAQYPDAASADGHDFGAVYVFRRHGPSWMLERYVKPVRTLTGASTDVRSRGYFGSSIAFSMEAAYAAMGAPGSSRGAVFGGAVQVFRRGPSWAFEYEMFPSADQAASQPTQHRFGAALSLDRRGRLLAIGDPATSAEGVSQAGVVHLMSRDGTAWTRQTTLRAIHPTAFAHFGATVALNGPSSEHLTVGVPGDRSALAGLQRPAQVQDDTSTSRDRSGAVYRYQYIAGEWKLKARLKAPVPTIDAHLGLSLAVDQDGAFTAVGSEVRDEAGGEIFIY